MPRRSVRSLPPHEAERLHAELEASWRQTCEWMSRVPIASPVYVALDALATVQVVALKAARRFADLPPDRRGVDEI